jgi:peptidoglycan hydrolase FlgJ
MSTLPISPDLSAAAGTDTYTDFSGLQALKRAAANNDPAAVRRVAQQFESMFTRMMLKSMRDAVGTDPIFGSDQEQMYQGMYDDQLALQLSKGRGLGLADMLVRQLQRLGGSGASPATATGATPATKQNFVQGLWPQAQAAAQQLGVDPRNLIAQAALETGWGRSLPHDGLGNSSNNLFGIKAGSWEGPSVSAATTEVSGGEAGRTIAPFRAYADAAQSFQDYVSILRDNPRYAAALNTGSDARAFATGLQRGGYATDPDYARKVTAVARDVAGSLAAALGGPASLKSGADLPTTVTSSTL